MVFPNMTAATKAINCTSITKAQVMDLNPMQLLALHAVVVRMPYRDDYYYRVLTMPNATVAHYAEILEDGTRWVSNGANLPLKQGLQRLLITNDYEVKDCWLLQFLSPHLLSAFNSNAAKDTGEEATQRRQFIQALNSVIEGPQLFDPFNL